MDTLQILSDIYWAVLSGLFDLLALLLQWMRVYLNVVPRWLGTSSLAQYIWLAFVIPSFAVAAIYLTVVYPLDRRLMVLGRLWRIRRNRKKRHKALQKQFLAEEKAHEQIRLARAAMQ